MLNLSSVVPAHARPSTLASLDLSDELLLAAMRSALIQSRRVTDFHPRGWDNNELYGEGTAGLREILQPHNWTTYREGGVEGVMNAAGDVAIIVSSGTRETGRDDGPAPRTKNPKGSATKRAVNANQPALFGSDDRAGSVKTWILLHYLDYASDELRLELSLPRSMRGNYVGEWETRILLASLPLGLKSTEVSLPADADVAPVIDIAWRDQAAE